MAGSTRTRGRPDETSNIAGGTEPLGDPGTQHSIEEQGQQSGEHASRRPHSAPSTATREQPDEQAGSNNLLPCSAERAHEQPLLRKSCTVLLCGGCGEISGSAATGAGTGMLIAGGAVD